MTSDLEREGQRLTELLAGKTIKAAKRHRETEIVLEFLDGARLFVDWTQKALEISITTSSRPPTQRDMIRRLLDEYGHNESAVCTAYVRAELGGLVERKRNDSGHTPDEYAAALWRDGHRNDRPWIIDYCRQHRIKT